MSSRQRDETHGGHDATFVTQLQPNDVLMGRGAPITDNIGNRRFLDLVREKCTGYQQAATRKEKDAIARQIVSIIHSRNGLFLRKIDSPEEAMHLGVPHQVAAWTAADEKTVLLKIKQALRDRGLEVREQVLSPSQDHAEATEATSQGNTEELGANETVAAGLPSSHAAPQPETAQEPRAKRAKTESLQDPASGDVSSQAPAPGLTMSAPAEVPNVGINRFQGVPDSMLNLQLPLRTNFSPARYRPGTAGYYSQLPIAPAAQLPIGQDWTAAAGLAGLNLSRAISIDLPPAATRANVGSEEGRLLGNLKRQAIAANSLTQAANLQQANEGEMKIDEKRLVSKEALEKETSGEIALRIACEVCEKGRETPSGGGGVKLDPIELCLLSVLSSRGLPTWSSTQFQDNGDIISAVVASTAATSDAPFPLTWTDVGNQLVQEVESFLSRKTSKLFPHDPPTLRGLAIAGLVSRLVSMAIAYSKNPTNLARVAIMLLEKLRRHSQFAPILPFAAAASATASSSAPPSFARSESAPPAFGRSVSWMSESESSRGGRGGGRGFARDAVQQRAAAAAADSRTRQGGEFLFQGFLTSELRRWATSLNVVDEVGCPVPFSSSEFAVNTASQYGQQQNDVFSTAAVLDAIGCQAILHQASFLTRLRSLLQTNSSDQVLATLRTFTSQAPATRWGITFVESSALDMSLIKALLTTGFSGLMMMEPSNTDDLLRTLLRHTSINKADVEKQVVQLTCLLHRHFQSKKINQVMSQQAAKLVEMMGR